MFLTASSSLLGLVLLVVGAVTLAQYSVFLDFVTPRYTETAVFLLVMGVIIVAISALGIYAVLKFHFCLMTVFLAMMVTVVVMEIIAAVTFFALNNDPSAQAATKTMLRKTISKYGSEGNPPASEQAWNLIQTDLSCCGVEGPGDYPDQAELPVSCCRERLFIQGQLEDCSRASASLHTAGCHRAFRGFLARKVGCIGAVAVVVAMTQIVMVVIASNLVKKWKIPGHCYPCY